MLAELAALVVFLFVLEPALVAVHELGHAVVPLALGRDTEIYVGGDRGPTLAVGHLTVTVWPPGFLRPMTAGATLSDVETGRWTLLGGTLGGPLASLLVAVGSWFVVTPGLPDVVWWLLVLTLLYSSLQAAFTLLPVTLPTTDGGEPYRSDGRIALELLFGQDPVLDEEASGSRELDRTGRRD